jgi:hypothetical protein
MGIRETHPLGRKAIEAWCWDFRILLVALEIAPTQVVSEDDHDMRERSF